MRVMLTGNTSFKLANFREGLIKRLVSDGHSVIVVAPKDSYSQQLIEMGCEFVPIKMKRNGTSPFSEIKLLISIFWRIKSVSPDIVLSFTIKNNIYAGISTRILNTVFVPNVTGLGPAFNGSGLLNSVVKFLYKQAFGSAERVFFQNTTDLQTFEASGLVDKKQTALLPGSGVDLAKFSHKPLVVRDGNVRFLFVARLLWEKGLGVFVSAATTVRKRHPNAIFQVLGPLDFESRAAVSEKQLNDWISDGDIEYLGSTKCVIPFLEGADCIVLPSYYKEGTPRSLLEAAAVGRPIITTDMPGCADAIRQNETGFLVEPKNEGDLVRAIENFLQLTNQEREQMGKASRRFVEENYSETIVIDAYYAVLSKAQLGLSSQNPKNAHHVAK